jgi:hypothetical protein
VADGDSGEPEGRTAEYCAGAQNSALPASSAGNALSLAFSYFANGNVSTITNNLNSARTETITYDNLNRVAIE